MSVVVSVEDIGSCQKKVTVAIPAPAVEAELSRVTDEFRRQVRLPGFRKGKTPLELVRKKFREEIERELLDRLLPRFWKQAEAESSLEPLLSPQVDDVEVEDGKDLTFVATVDVRPEVNLETLDGFDLPEVETEPSDEAVAEAIEDLRRAMADWKDAERPAARGDLVVATIRQLAENDTGSEVETRPTTFEIGDERVWEELTMAATGMVAGQETRFERVTGEAGGGVSVSYDLAVEKVRERDLAPLDDAFAARVSEYETVDALTEGMRARLRAGNERERRVKRETALLDQLCERYPVDVPKRVVDKEIEEMLSDYASALANQGVDLDGADIDWQRMAAEARPRAEKRVRARLLVDAAAEKNGLVVSEEELEKAIANMARSQKTSSVSLRRTLDRAGRLGELRQQLKREKTLNMLLGESSDPDETEKIGRDEDPVDEELDRPDGTDTETEEA
jgi:trigger factor